FEVMQELLKRGANPNAQNDAGESPLHMAAMNGLVDRVQLLLQYGANATLRNAEGKTPLDVANKKWLQVRELMEKYSTMNKRADLK
ncbi:MAG: ankyrin repeat domain-containing protein, partial [Candidatus Acidiferrales bacterium]